MCDALFAHDCSRIETSQSPFLGMCSKTVVSAGPWSLHCLRYGWIFGTAISAMTLVAVQLSGADGNAPRLSRIHTSTNTIDDCKLSVRKVSVPAEVDGDRSIIAFVAPRPEYTGSNFTYRKKRDLAFFLESEGDGAMLRSIDPKGVCVNLVKLEGVLAFRASIHLQGDPEQLWVLTPEKLLLLDEKDYSIRNTIRVSVADVRKARCAATRTGFMFLTNELGNDGIEWSCDLINFSRRSVSTVDCLKNCVIVRIAASPAKQEFAISWREDLHAPDSGGLKLLDSKDGSVKWSIENVFPLSLVLLDDHILFVDGSSHISIYGAEGGRLKGKLVIDSDIEAVDLFLIENDLFVACGSTTDLLRITGVSHYLSAITQNNSVINLSLD